MSFLGGACTMRQASSVSLIWKHDITWSLASNGPAVPRPFHRLAGTVRRITPLRKLEHHDLIDNSDNNNDFLSYSL
jgi:hypothetical protein